MAHDLHIRLMHMAVMALSVMLPSSALEALRRARFRQGLGRLGRPQPLGRSFGLDRGLPIDRYYIERFLESRAADVRGRVLEVGDSQYTTMFGGERVKRRDVLHAVPGNPEATLVGDLASGRGIPDESFDCFICTQTLMFIYDVREAVRTMHRLLKPGGVALVTVAGVSQICRYDMDQWGDYWRFTTLAMSRMFGEVFGEANVQVESRGNVLACVGFLHGMATDDLERADLDVPDDDYQLVITVRAVKPIMEACDRDCR